MASLYSDLIDKLLEQISTMEKGARLPSERQLCMDYGVSRTTVRNALGSLVNSGVLYQIQGKGTLSGKDLGKTYRIITLLPSKQKKGQGSKVISYRFQGQGLK